LFTLNAENILLSYNQQSQRSCQADGKAKARSKPAAHDY